VAEYYITELFDEGSQPALKVKINKPKKFWDELVVRLIATDNYMDKIKILQTMNLMYMEYYLEIKELTIMSYIIKILSISTYPEFQYLILQLIYNALGVPHDRTANSNLIRFQDAGGLSVLRDFMLSTLH
jgi:hypothetical protein